MLREPTIEKLHTLRLRILAAAWLEQDKSPDVLALSFDERLALLVDAETLARDNSRLMKNLREASAGPKPSSGFRLAEDPLGPRLGETGTSCVAVGPRMEVPASWKSSAT
jgi:hypothetical protein